jgi:hypothetical protein
MYLITEYKNILGKTDGTKRERIKYNRSRIE